MTMTCAQAEALNFIRSYQAKNMGASPSFDEIRSFMGLSSKSGVHRIVSGLVERGLIKTIPNRKRCLVVVDQEAERKTLSGVSTRALIAELSRRREGNRREA